MDVLLPRLTTPRLLLRQLRPEDVPDLVKYADNRKISDQIVNIPYPYREPQAAFRIAYVARGFKQGTHYVFAIIWEASQELIGEVSLHLDDARRRAQLSYWIGEPFWNQGIATEAAGAVLAFGFERLDLSHVIASHYAENPASGRVLEKIGLLATGRTGNLIQYRLSR